MRTLRFVLPLALTLTGFAACGGGGLVTSDAGPAGGGMTGTGGGVIGTGGTVLGTGGATGSGGAGAPGGEGGEAQTGFGGAAPECDRHVHILLQKSGAMFQSPSSEDSWWDAIADALTHGLVQEFDAQVELSVSVFSKNTSDLECPVGATLDAPIDADELADALDEEKADFDEMDNAEPQVKVDAPVVEAVEGATALLSADQGGYIVLIASDMPDTCETNDSQCTVEEVYGAVQAAHEAGVETRVVYLESVGMNLDGYPQGVANAGVGLGIEDTNLGCGADFEYSDAPGTAPFAAPENTDAVRQALADILGDIAACD